MAITTESLLDRRIADPKFGKALEALVPRYRTALVRRDEREIYYTKK